MTFLFTPVIPAPKVPSGEGVLDSYGFEREQAYLKALRTKVQGGTEALPREFVESVRSDVLKRLEALTR